MSSLLFLLIFERFTLVGFGEGVSYQSEFVLFAFREKTRSQGVRGSVMGIAGYFAFTGSLGVEEIVSVLRDLLRRTGDFPVSSSLSAEELRSRLSIFLQRQSGK